MANKVIYDFADKAVVSDADAIVWQETDAIGNYRHQTFGELKNQLTFETLVRVRVEADLPTPILAPDGNLRHPLLPGIAYFFDTTFMTMVFPLWIPSASVTGETLLFSRVGTKIQYTSTAPLIYGRDLSISGHSKMLYEAAIPGTKCFDVIGNSSLLITSLVDISQVIFTGMDLGTISGMNLASIEKSSVSSYNGPLKLHDCSNIAVETFTPISLSVTGGPLITITGISNQTSSISSSNGAFPAFSNNSFLAIDSGATLSEMSLANNVSLPIPGTFFFEPDLTGSITAFSNLATLITGNPTLYEDDGNGNVLVTVTDTALLYVGLTTAHSGTTNYNGNSLTTKIVSTTQFVMDATYVADEVSGSYTGIGTRVTTSAPHLITDNRITDISGTTNYNGVGLLVPKTLTSDFDITTPFVADDATGTYLTTSLDQDSIFVKAKDNGNTPNSQKIAFTYLTIGRTVTGSGTAFTDIGGTNWSEIVAKDFITDNTGTITYVGINPTSKVVHGTAVVSKVGGGTDLIALRIALNGVSRVASQGQTENLTPTQITCFDTLDLQSGDTITLQVINLTGAAEVLADKASLLPGGG